MARSDAEGSRASSRALIVTLYGLYARETGSWLSVASVVALMAQLGVDEMAVRSSISRLKHRGLLRAERVDGAAGYRLSDAALAVFEDGDRRIFVRTPSEQERGWVLAVFSVPESERARRHQLRTQLAWLGFGTVSSGVWIAPARLLHDSREVLLRLGLDGYVDLFLAEHEAFRATGARVAQWWDLSALAEFYADFIRRYGPLRRRYRMGLPSGPAQYVDYVDVLTAWRRLPYLDPGLPAPYLPSDWNGPAASEIFFDLHHLLADAAHEFARTLVIR